MNQVDQLNGAALAYIGDAIYEVYVRQHVITSGLTQPNRLHRAATRYVEELTIYKRGRNHKANTKAKNASIGDYRQATGFEALLGWLHLSGQSQRLEELIAQSLALIDQRGQ